MKEQRSQSEMFRDALEMGPVEMYGEYKIVGEDEFVEWLKFGDQDAEAGAIVVPPEAGHGAEYVAFASGKSLVETMLKGCDSVIVPRFKGAKRGQRDKTMEDSEWEVRGCLKWCKRKPDVVGFCQGGWQAAMSAAIRPELYGELFLINAPIDLTPSPGSIGEKLKKIPQWVFELNVLMNCGIQKGKDQLNSWKMMHAEDRFWNDFVDIWEVAGGNEEDMARSLIGATGRKVREKRAEKPLEKISYEAAEKMIAKIKYFRSRYERTLDMNGAGFCGIVLKIFRENQLHCGELVVYGEKVDLGRITQAVNVIWSTEDDITMKREALGIKGKTSGGVRISFTPGGHLGGGISRGSQKALRKAVLRSRGIARVNARINSV